MSSRVWRCSLKRARLLAVAGLALSVIVNTGTVAAQHDPGPRVGDAGAGGPLPGLSQDLQSFFDDARVDFMELDSVSGTISGEEGAGLGPTFNGTGCAQCHAHPAVGGSSPMINPQVALANLDGATEYRSFLYYYRWSGAGSPIHPQPRRFARWRGARLVHHNRSDGC